MATGRITASLRGSLGLLAGLLRALGVAGLGGTVAGLLVGGLGGRVAMRISAIAAGPASAGTLTANGNTVGEITLEGTIALAIFGGLFAGIAGALVYVAVRPWVGGSGWLRGAVFGCLLLATFGFAVIEPANPDFRRFGPPLLNIALFAALFPLFGVVAVPVLDWLDRSLPSLPPRRPIGLGTLGAYALTGITALLALLALGLVAGDLADEVRRGASPDPFWGVLLLVVLVVALGARAWLGRVDRRVDLAHRRGSRAVGTAALAVPVLVGLGLTVQAVGDTLRLAG